MRYKAHLKNGLYRGRVLQVIAQINIRLIKTIQRTNCPKMA